MSAGGTLAVRLPNWLGDAVLALRAVDALAAHAGPARLTLIARPWAEPLFGSRWPGARWLPAPAGRGGWPAHVPALAALGASEIVIFPPSQSARLHAFFAGVPRRLGLGGEPLDFLLTHRAPRALRGERHLEDEYLDVARLTGASPVPRLPLEPDPAARARVRERLEGDVLVIAPGARYGPAKRWPPERFAEAARLWARAQPDPSRARVWIVGGEEDRAPAQAVLAASASAPHATRDLSGRTDLVMLARALERAKAVVSNDSGVAHLAAAFDRVVAVIFGSTDPRWTAPRRPHVRVVSEPIPCAPCFRRECAIADRERCLKGVSAERVAETLLEASGRAHAEARA